MTPELSLFVIAVGIVWLALLVWFFVLLTGINRRLQDISMILLARHKPDSLDAFRTNRLAAAVRRAWR